MRIAINGNKRQDGHLDQIARLVDSFVAADHEVVVARPFLDYLADRLGHRFPIGLIPMELSQKPCADLAVSIGGDGAFLKTARWVADGGEPVAGINTGHLGFLSAFTFDRPEEIRSCLLQGRFDTDERTLMEVSWSGALPGETPRPETLTALNEVAITRSDTASMARLPTRVDGRDSLTYSGDGLIISTPTGSTAYNLSVGGPILDPRLGGFVLSPIAAHSLNIRPVVVSDSSVIEVVCEGRAPTLRVAVDGKAFPVPTGTRVTVRKAPYKLRIVQNPGHCFSDTLLNKLGLGGLV
ncbi:MAG: NAD(+)/NADH kinase [[Clostridium] fimetarium]|nr:NAD(+)/NADH kinase [Alistipes timonensis]MCM1406791.1 NAD(+)/NADH kinase [[Clostridium] fimetarium]